MQNPKFRAWDKVNKKWARDCSITLDGLPIKEGHDRITRSI